MTQRNAYTPRDYPPPLDCLPQDQKLAWPAEPPGVERWDSSSPSSVMTDSEKPSSKESFKEIRARAEAADVVAQFNLGWMNDEGENVPLDDTEAVRWYRLAADQRGLRP